MQDEIKFHTDRAMAELDLARRAADGAAAQAHLSLSALHLDRMREICEAQLPPLRTASR